MPRTILNPFMFFNLKYAKLTVNAVPNDATVTFDTGRVVGNTCTVHAGTVVGYTVSRDGLVTVTGSITVTHDMVLSVDMYYQNGTVFFESGTAGTYTLAARLVDMYCEIICVGGGAGGAGASMPISSMTSSGYTSASGGGGGGYSVATLKVAAAAQTIVVGAGGAGATKTSNYHTTGNMDAYSTAGGNSSFGSYVSAGGGGRAYAKPSAGNGGSGGSGTTQTGNAGGHSHTTSNSASASGGAARYGSYGKGGNASASHSSYKLGNNYHHTCNASAAAGNAGYVKVSAATPQNYLLTIIVDPTINLILSTAGHTQAGNTIMVDPNTDVTYILSRVGYHTETNTFRIDADTTIAIDAALKPIYVEEIDCGHISEVSDIRNAGLISEQVDITKDAGGISGIVSTTKDAGPIVSILVPEETLDMGQVTGTTELTIDCGELE